MIERDRRALKLGFWIAAFIAIFLLVSAPSLGTATLLFLVAQSGLLLFKKRDKQSNVVEEETEKKRATVTLKDGFFIVFCSVLLPYIVISIWPNKASHMDTTNFVLLGILGWIISLTVLRNFKYPVRPKEVQPRGPLDEQ